MARWKARAEFLLSVIELLFLSLTVETLQGKMCKNSLASGVGRSLGAIVSDIAIFVLKRDVKLQLTNLEPKFQGEVVAPEEYFFLVSTKLDTFCYLTVQTAPCYVPSF